MNDRMNESQLAKRQDMPVFEIRKLVKRVQKGLIGENGTRGVSRMEAIQWLLKHAPGIFRDPQKTLKRRKLKSR